jgi:hypothetical protein
MSKSKSQKGSIGFVYGGNIIKVGTVITFVSEDSKPEQKFEKLKKGPSEEEVKKNPELLRMAVGPYASCRYVPCENQNKMYEELKKKLADTHIVQDHYSSFSTTVVNIMKEITGSKTVHKLSTESKEKKGETDTEKDSEDEVDKKDKKKKKAEKKSEKKTTDTEKDSDDDKKADKKSEKKSEKKADKKDTKKADKKDDKKSDKKDDKKDDKKSDKKGGKKDNSGSDSGDSDSDN